MDKRKEAINISPNPITDFLTISDVSQVQSMSVTDTSGRLIKTFEKVSAPIDLGNLKEGIYFISLKMKNGSTKVLKAIKK